MPSQVADSMQKKHASAGVAMSVATLSMAAASGLQALLYLNSFGVNGRTDGFFVAFALYTIVGVFSQSIRMTSANLLIGERPRLVTAEYGVCLGLIAIPILILTIPFADQFAQLLAPGLEQRRSRRHRRRPAAAGPGRGAAALVGGRGDAAGGPRPLQRDRRRLHRRRRRRPRRLRGRGAAGRRAGARLVDAGDGGGDAGGDAFGLRRARPETDVGEALLRARPPGLDVGPDPRPDGDLPRLQRPLHGHARLRQRLRRRRRHRPLLRVPVRQLPGRRDRLRARPLAHRRHAPRRRSASGGRC